MLDTTKGWRKGELIEDLRPTPREEVRECMNQVLLDLRLCIENAEQAKRVRSLSSIEVRLVYHRLGYQQLTIEDERYVIKLQREKQQQESQGKLLPPSKQTQGACLS